MNASTKVFATLSIAAAVGDRIKRTGHTENIRGAGIALEHAGLEAARIYPSAGLSKNVLKIVDSVRRLLSDQLYPQEILSMTIAGLSDIHAKCNPARHEMLESVICAAQTCLDFYPDGIDHATAFDRYCEWIES